MSPLRISLRAFADRPDTGLGWRFVTFHRGRLAAAIGGIAVAVLVMFVELGLMVAILQSEAGLAGLIDGDLVIMNATRDTLHEWTRIAPVRLAQAAAIQGVRDAAPVFESGMLLRNPPDISVHRIIAFGIRPQAPPLKLADPELVHSVLSRPNEILFDSLSRGIYGPVAPGRNLLLDGRPFEVGGMARIGPDVIMDGAVVLSEGAWLAADPGAQPVMGVLRLEPGADLETVRARLIRALPRDVSIMTPGEIFWREVWFTFRSAPIGIIFGVGVAAGAFIGGVICYQIMFNEVTDLRKELATLKAMGFGGGFFRRLILEQAYLLAGAGFAIGLLGAWAAYAFLGSATGLAMTLDWRAILFVALPAALMAHLGALFALRHLSGFEPAELY
jgi:putative ABC transport system permease protein